MYHGGAADHMAWPNFGRTGVHSVHVEGGGLQAPVLFSLLAKFQLIVPRLQAACWILGRGQSTSQQVWQVSTRSMNWPNAFCHFPPKRCFGCGPLLFSAWKSVFWREWRGKRVTSVDKSGGGGRKRMETVLKFG